MTSQVLRTLERKGLISREVDAGDTRARKVRVTESGAALAPRAIAVVEQVDGSFFGDIAQRDPVGFLRSLLK
jgi:DNA-binding MarR family transcriptional regulator